MSLSPSSKTHCHYSPFVARDRHDLNTKWCITGKSLFPLVGAQGITSLRLGIGTLILFVILNLGGCGLLQAAVYPY